LVTLESNPIHAAVARANIERAGLSHIIDLRIGPALDSLHTLVAEGSPPFDFIFFDADKPNNPAYLTWALQLARLGTIIIGDNVVRDGHVADPESTDANVVGVRHFLALLADEPRVSATAIETVGSKGYDGFVLARVIS
jgi:predicted O-methyltransferase YrrM